MEGNESPVVFPEVELRWKEDEPGSAFQTQRQETSSAQEHWRT